MKLNTYIIGRTHADTMAFITTYLAVFEQSEVHKQNITSVTYTEAYKLYGCTPAIAIFVRNNSALTPTEKSARAEIAKLLQFRRCAVVESLT